MSIREVVFLEQNALELENDSLKVTVLPQSGSNVISIFDKEKQVELLRTPKSKEEYENRKMLFGTPVLFPPNRIEDAEFEFNNKKYKLEMNRAKENVHIHGFVHDKEWEVEKVDEENNILVTKLRSNTYSHIINQYPHDFALEMIIELTNNGVKQTLKITNNGQEKMPIGVGYHTTFNFPIETSKLFIDIENRWELNERHLPTGELVEVDNKKEFRNGILLKGKALDDVYPITSQNKANIEVTEWKTKVTYTALDGFKHWVLFTASGTEDLLAIEPYSWVTNAPNLLKLSPELTGFSALESKETKQFVTNIEVEHY